MKDTQGGEVSYISKISDPKDRGPASVFVSHAQKNKFRREF